MFRYFRLPPGYSSPLSLLLTLLAMLLAVGCTRLDPPGPDQPLVVGLPDDPIFQQLVPPTDGMDGYSRDLAALFAESLDVEIRYVTAPDYPTLLQMVRERKVHFAAAVSAQYGDPQLRYTPPLRETRQIVVQHASALPVDAPEKLAGREVAVLPGARQIEALRSLKVEPAPTIVEHAGIDELELLSMVARRRHDLAASDDLHFAVAANYHPDLAEAFELPGKLAYVWAFDATNEALHERASRFIESMRADGTLRRLDDRYFGHIRRLDTHDIEAFLEHIRTRLPEFRHQFQEAQEITGIDWRLIAALAYQESQWDPNATSPTGVRGMMMLTSDTADRLKVSNRLDARQSIRAGAKYLAMLMDDLPDSIRHPDRLWFALAAYNLGMGHLNGARIFAPGLKRDPDIWVDMKQVLPLLSRPEYYKRLKSGRARGGEAVILVENIRNYYDVLSRFEPVYTPPSLGDGKSGVKKMKRKAPAKKPKPASQR
jgi:membrane-bound lytic murein transglycosylase F